MQRVFKNCHQKRRVTRQLGDDLERTFNHSGCSNYWRLTIYVMESCYNMFSCNMQNIFDNKMKILQVNLWKGWGFQKGVCVIYSGVSKEPAHYTLCDRKQVKYLKTLARLNNFNNFWAWLQYTYCHILKLLGYFLG